MSDVQAPTVPVNNDFMFPDRDDVFDTGMTHMEALSHAHKWWNENRGRIPFHFNHVKEKPNKVGKGFVIKQPDEKHLPAGILSGDAWDDLDEREKLIIAEHWHDQFVRHAGQPADV